MPARVLSRRPVFACVLRAADEKQAVFDENAILNNLSPSLHSELVASICKDTLGKIPLFAKLSPEFQAHIFPLVKPLSFNRGDVIYASGSASDDLLFLIDGSVDMLSEVDGTTPARRFYQEEEVCSLTRRAIAHPHSTPSHIRAYAYARC